MQKVKNICAYGINFVPLHAFPSCARYAHAYTRGGELETKTYKTLIENYKENIFLKKQLHCDRLVLIIFNQK